MQQHNDALGTEKISKLVVRLAVPSVVAQLINLVYNMVDRIYIGHIPIQFVCIFTTLQQIGPFSFISSA